MADDDAFIGPHDDRKGARRNLDEERTLVALRHLVEFLRAVGDDAGEDVEPSGRRFGIGGSRHAGRQLQALHQRDEVDATGLQYSARTKVDRHASRIEVTEGHALSLQKHDRKQETMYLQSGRLLYHLNGEDFEMTPGQCITIHPGDVVEVAQWGGENPLRGRVRRVEGAVAKDLAERGETRRGTSEVGDALLGLLG